MTTSEYFDSLFERVNLKIGDEERIMIEEKQNTLRERLREKLPVKDDFLTGSYARHTIIKPRKDSTKFDVDIFIAFDNSDYGDKDLAELREMVVNALEAIKNEDNGELEIDSIVDSQRRSVRVDFSNDFQIDVVPALEIEKDKLYKIYDRRTLKPVKSNPKLHSKLLTEANERTGGKLVPMIKILKGWKRIKCDYLKSFHLEMLATVVLGGEKIDSFLKGFAKFFKEAEYKLKTASLPDPANPSNYIDAYLDDDQTRSKALTLVTAQAKVAQHAVELFNEGKEDEAVNELNKIFEDESETAASVESGGFYPASGAVAVTESDTNNGSRINSPRSWRN